MEENYIRRVDSTGEWGCCSRLFDLANGAVYYLNMYSRREPRHAQTGG